MTKIRDKKEKRIRVLEEQRRRDRKRLAEVGQHAKKIYNITSQIKIKKVGKK